MADKLFAVRRSDVTESGLWPSDNSLDVPLWQDGRNVIFAQGGPQKVPGHVAPTGLSGIAVASNIRGMGALRDMAAIQRLFVGTVSALAMWVAGSLTDVTRVSGPYTGYADEASTHLASTWSFVRFGNFMYATNGKDLGQKWLGSDEFQDWTTTWTRARKLLPLGPHLLALATDQHPGGAEWCSADNPDDWSPSSTNSAGFQDIRDIDGELISGVLAKGGIVAASASQLYKVSYIGAPFYVSIVSLGLDGCGAVGPAAMVGTNSMVYGMSDAGIWASDGTKFWYIDDEPIRDFIKSKINADQRSKVCFSYDSNNDTVWVSFPGASGENEWTLTYRATTQAWGIQPYGRSSMLQEPGVFLKPYMAGVEDSGTTSVFQHNTGVDADGVAVDSYVRTKLLDCGDSNAIKEIDFVKVQVRRLAGTCRVRVGAADTLTGPITWSSYQTLSAGFAEVFFLTEGINGQFLALEVSSVALAADWAITGFEIWGTVTGYAQ